MKIFSKHATVGEKYRPAMEVLTQKEADEYFEVLVQSTMEHWGKTREEAESLERQNLGYFAGYYGEETRERVERLFCCAHPLLGRIADHNPSPEECFKMGQEWAESQGEAS